MKKVFTKSEDVIHLFAQQDQYEARCSNVFFYGEKIYSYGHHYLLGEFLDEFTILINDSGYSVTTAKHIRQIIWATSQYKQFLKTETDLDSVYYEIKENQKKLTRARKPEMYINRINYLFEKYVEFAEYKRKKLKLGKRYFSAYANDKFKEVRSLVKQLEKENGLESLQEFQRKETKKRKAREAKEIKKNLVKFLNYEINSFRIGEEDFLRLSQDGEKVETTQGVKVFVNSAKILYKMILAGQDIKGHRIDGFTVTSINGTLKIGCHNINMESVHKVGKQIM
jgi:hypothetical protein